MSSKDLDRLSILQNLANKQIKVCQAAENMTRTSTGQLPRLPPSQTVKTFLATLHLYGLYPELCDLPKNFLSRS